MTNERYNGWTNYETWTVGLWLTNHFSLQAYWLEQARRHHEEAPTCSQVESGIWKPEEAAKFNLADQLKNEVGDDAPLNETGMYSDLLNTALSEVNWHEIAEEFLTDFAAPEEKPAAEAEPEPPAEAQPEPESLPVIYRYTRAQAIEDGVLVDVSETARRAGIVYPVALSAAVWAGYVSVPRTARWQDESDRLWDILICLGYTIARSKGEQEMIFSFYVQNDQRRPALVKLKAVCGPGDDAKPVITIMLPNED